MNHPYAHGLPEAAQMPYPNPFLFMPHFTPRMPPQGFPTPLPPLFSAFPSIQQDMEFGGSSSGEVTSNSTAGKRSREPETVECDAKRYRTTYSLYQTKVLEETFASERYINRPKRTELAKQLGLPENTIKVCD